MLERFPRSGEAPSLPTCPFLLHPRALPPRPARGLRSPGGSASLERSVLPSRARHPQQLREPIPAALPTHTHPPGTLREGGGRGIVAPPPGRDANARRLAPAPERGSRPAWPLASLFPIQPGRSSRGTFFFVWEKKSCHKFIYLKDFSPENSPSRLPFSESESLT